MIYSLFSGVQVGALGHRVTIEVNSGGGIPGLHIVGLPDMTIRESRDRIKIALKQSHYALPNKKFTVNLLPADLKKQGSQLDLALAAGILIACGEPVIGDPTWGYVGELRLTGEVKSFQSSFSIVEGMIEAGCRHIVVPEDCWRLLEAFPQTNLYLISQLAELGMYKGREADLLQRSRDKASMRQGTDSECLTEAEDFGEILGHESVKKALTAAIAGGHHTLMIGPPGTGKTMMAKRLMGIFPDLSPLEQLEVLRVKSHLEESLTSAHQMQRPFRRPHTGISAAGMFGGSKVQQLGEVTLAHRGILFLDEMPEFKRDVIEGLRDPLESKTVSLSKAGYKVQWPADFTLIATANPCPCGYRGYSSKCTCNDYQVTRYFSKLSGPILDRFDIKLDVHLKQVEAADYFEPQSKNKRGQSLDQWTTAAMRQAVIRAREMQRDRFKGDHKLNAQMAPKEIETYVQLTPKGHLLLKDLFKNELDSMRSLHKILRLSRTLADLEASSNVEVPHLLEAFRLNRRSL